MIIKEIRPDINFDVITDQGTFYYNAGSWEYADTEDYFPVEDESLIELLDQLWITEKENKFKLDKKEIHLISNINANAFSMFNNTILIKDGIERSKQELIKYFLKKGEF